MVSNISLAQHFDQYFCVELAISNRNDAFRIRHEVYAKELGWEPTNDAGLEQDEYDDHAFHLLLLHRRSGKYAGCVRLVTQPNSFPDHLLPFEAHCSSALRKEPIDVATLTRGSFGEISRLAVPSFFRRRPGEQNKPFSMGDFDPKHELTESELRAVPNIAIGLYLGSLALASILEHNYAFALMEPRLCKRLARLGILFDAISDEIEWRGTRVVYAIDINKLEENFDTKILEFYILVKNELMTQINTPGQPLVSSNTPKP